MITVHKLLPEAKSFTSLSSQKDEITSFWKTLDSSKKEEIFKKTAFIDTELPILSKNELIANASEIATEFCALAYDVIDIQRQHQNYLKHFHNYRVAELSDFELVQSYQQYQDYFQGIPNEHIQVEHILHAIISQVEMLCDSQPDTHNVRQTQPSPVSSMESLIQTITPMRCSVGDKIILEAQDSLIQDTFRKDNVDVESLKYYNDHIQTLFVGFDELHCIWKQFPKYENKLKIAILAHGKDYSAFEHSMIALFLRTSEDNISSKLNDLAKLNLNSICDGIKKIVQNLKDTDLTNKCYIDMVTSSTLQQQLSICYRRYDRVKYQYCSLTDNLLVKFENDSSRFQTNTRLNVLPTYLCFRDYVGYVMPEQLKWIEKEERRYDGRYKNIVDLKMSLESSCGGSIADLHQTEFFRNDSLKQQKLNVDTKSILSKEECVDAVLEGMSVIFIIIIFCGAGCQWLYPKRCHISWGVYVTLGMTF